MTGRGDTGAGKPHIWWSHSKTGYSYDINSTIRNAVVFELRNLLVCVYYLTYIIVAHIQKHSALTAVHE